MKDAKKLIDVNYIIVEGIVMQVEKLDRPYYFMDGTRLDYSKMLLPPPTPSLEIPK